MYKIELILGFVAFSAVVFCPACGSVSELKSVGKLTSSIVANPLSKRLCVTLQANKFRYCTWKIKTFLREQNLARKKSQKLRSGSCNSISKTRV